MLASGGLKGSDGDEDGGDDAGGGGGGGNKDGGGVNEDSFADVLISDAVVTKVKSEKNGYHLLIISLK